MKLKPIYIYIFSLILLIVLIIVFTDKTNENERINTKENKTMNGNIPDDEIHRGMKNDMGPGRENVNKEFFRMLEKLKKMADENPKDTAKNREYAQILLDAHNPKEAIPYFKRVIEIDPKRTDILFNLTVCYFNIKDFENAELYTRKILEIEKNNFKAIYNLGVIAITSGDTLKAKNYWNDILKRSKDPQDIQIAKSSLERIK